MIDKITAEQVRSEIWTLYAPRHHGVVAFSDMLRLYSSWCSRDELEGIMNDFVLSRVATRRIDSDGITYLFPEFPRRELRRINVDFERENKEFEMATAASDLIAEVKRMWIGGIDGLDESQKAAVAQYLSRYWDKEAEPYRAAEAKARTERKRLEGSISELRKLLEGV